jgi:alpha-ketoglutarate-dependent taurine dioxygenase
MTRITASIGVELHGVRLTEVDPDDGVDDAVVGMLRTAVAEHHVVILRDQFLSAAQQATVASAFGPIMSSPVQIARGAAATGGAVSTIEDTADRPPAGFPWHTDVSWIAQPPALGFLSAVTIPAFGGDTMWASTSAVFDALPPDVQALCERSAVVHVPDESLLSSVERHHGADVAERLRRDHPGVHHPLVSVHPMTGRKSLFLSPLYARRIVGPAAMDRRLLADLHAMLDDPHIHMRWRWREGDLVIWDEAATCHRALTDHHPQHRVMRRCVTGAS